MALTSRPADRPGYHGMTERPRLWGRVPPWSSWTLSTKLVTSMAALFAAVTLIAGVSGVFALHQFLTNQIDQQLDGYFLRQPPDNDGPGTPPPNRGRGPGIEGLLLIVNDSHTVTYNSATTIGNTLTALSGSQISQLGSGLGRQPTTVALAGDLGDYRVVAGRSAASNATVVVGLPLSQTQHTVNQMAWLVALTSVGGIILLSLAGLWAVRRNLKPLGRVVATATRVARLPLASGRVHLSERVPAADTDTRTEVGQVGYALNQMLDHVNSALNARQRSEERVRQFVADASHELRTPLSSIRGYAELTRHEPDPTPPAVVYAIGLVESEAIRMSALVDDLLLLARIDAGRPLDVEPVDVTEIVLNAVSDAHVSSPLHSWHLDLPNEPVEAIGDSARLHQVVANLLANARTHTAPGTVVTTILRQDPDQVCISVHDNGGGIPIELQPSVFDPFVRGDTSRHRASGSTGLGLSIVSAVTRAHGGRVSVDSHPGDTTFRVSLPRRTHPRLQARNDAPVE